MFIGKFDGKFQTDRKVDNEVVSVDLFGRDDVAYIITKYGGASFNKGIYRIHKPDEIVKWTGIVTSVFSKYENEITCFGFDWLGRQFAIRNLNESQILMLDVDTGEVLNAPINFADFHNEELVEFSEAALSEGMFEEWIRTQSSPLRHSDCVGFKIPLHLGGKDELVNRERVDMEVHWSLGAQILEQIKPVKDEQRVGRVSTNETRRQ